MQLYNTLTRKKEPLTLLKKGEIRIYTCGLTVYSQPHIGNWVGYVYWDVLGRTLEQEGLRVLRTQNYTDVGHLVSDDDNGEDKMQKGARAEGITAWQVAEKYIAIAEDEAYTQLGLIRPTNVARATDYIAQQIAFVQKLESDGFTYTIADEGVYFDTSKLPDYGKLARLDIKGLQAGARVEVEGKKNITDFAVWKFSPKNEKRDMEWQSPWGVGFPGWHLECSVIAQQTLGDQIDIHAGGVDHIPVHHTNEIAQTEAVTGKQFSTVWVHNNHLKVDGGKMSKSLGNIYTLQDILDKSISLDAFKLMILSKHYRTEGNFTWDILQAAQNRLNNWLEVASLRWQPLNDTETNLNKDFATAISTINNALQDDLGTPEALAAIDQIFSLVKTKTTISAKDVSVFTNLLEHISSSLGINLLASTQDIADEQKQQVAKRQKARESKDWATVDELKAALQDQGITVKDTNLGTIWSR